MGDDSPSKKLRLSNDKQYHLLSFQLMYPSNVIIVSYNNEHGVLDTGCGEVMHVFASRQHTSTR